ncbi:amidohydrolase family protein [Sorangium sp. So ce542]|uniref:amidohydrolase family protein n=1 Tax=Sorangium sp. So ce542 TaxID=3133316 RepID=UPI003F641EF5
MHPTELPYTVVHDADSHIMPTRRWLEAYAEPAHRSAVRRALPDWEPALAPYYDAALRQTASFGDRAGVFRNALRGPKSGFAPGALDRDERSELLDALGIGSQLVFSTFVMPRLCGGAFTPREAAAVSRAHNRGIAEFCSRDRRLVAVGAITFHDPKAALAEIERATRDGIRAVQVPTDAFWERGPSHADLDPFWAACAAAGIAVISHIGGGELLPGVYHRIEPSGEAAPDQAGETLRPKDFAVAHHTVERFLTCLILDGVLDRHPGLRVGVIEQGASWLVSLMRRLDQAAYHFRSDATIAKLSLRPSEYLRRHVRVTPHFFEDVGWLIAQVGEEMLMFSTDYPHFEGGTDPVGRFEASFDAAGTSAGAREKFYVGNYQDLVTLG